jgi:hypothetical protein
MLATGADLSLPEVDGRRPVPLRLINAYIDRFLAAAEHDVVLTDRFFRVAGLLDPPTRLFRPPNMLRVWNSTHQVHRAQSATTNVEGTTVSRAVDASPRR